jgi:hypothetical protein
MFGMTDTRVRSKYRPSRRVVATTYKHSFLQQAAQHKIPISIPVRVEKLKGDLRKHLLLEKEQKAAGKLGLFAYRRLKVSLP